MFDKIKDIALGGLKTAVSFLKAKAIKIAGFIAEASFSSIAKYAIGAGVAIGTVLMTLKFFKDKFTMLHSKEGKTPVEQILDRNYSDHRNKKRLHRGMRKVSELLFNDKPRKATDKYGWVNDFIKRHEKKYGPMDGYHYDNPAGKTWWEENIRYMYDDVPDNRTVREKVDDFFDNFFNGNVDGYKDDDYEYDLRNVWDYGCMHGWGWEA